MKRSLIAVVTILMLALAPASALASESILSEAEQLSLKSILTCVSYVGEGVDKKPTIKVSGCNVQIINGTGSESTLNGEGNLIIGYNEEPHTQSGSHNLVLGNEQEYLSYGGLVAGADNGLDAPFADAFGRANVTASEFASVTGGENNDANGVYSSVTGGRKNIAVRQSSTVSGGEGNETHGVYSWIGGGHNHSIEAEWSIFPE